MKIVGVSVLRAAGQGVRTYPSMLATAPGWAMVVIVFRGF